MVLNGKTVSTQLPAITRVFLRFTLLAGGALAIGGATLDWTGVPYSSGLDRRIALGAGVAAVLLAALTGRRRLWPHSAALLPGVAALDMAVVNIHDIADHHYEYAALPCARVGVGLYVVLAGAVLVLLSSLTTFLPRVRRTLRSRTIGAASGTQRSRRQASNP